MASLAADAAFALAPLDEGFQRLVDGWIERRLLVIDEQLLPDGIGPPLRRQRARLAPALVVAPVGKDGRIECGLVALQGMADAEEMPARAHFLDRIESQRISVDHQRLHELAHALENLGIENYFLE